MIDTEDVATFSRIAGVGLSIASAATMFIKPFAPVTNTLFVYFLLMSAAVLVMIGQIITIRINIPGGSKTALKRHEALYDVITIGFVMILFIIFYVGPYIAKNTSWL